MQRHHTIRFKLNIIFMIAFVSLSFMLFISSQMGDRRNQHIAALQAPFIEQVLTLAKQDLNAKNINNLIRNYMVSYVEPAKSTLILTKGRRIKGRHPLPPTFDIYEYQNELYIYIKSFDIIFQYHHKKMPNENLFSTIIWALLFLLVLLYSALLHSFKPLKNIYNELLRYANGQTDIDISSKRKDEIAYLSNAFQEAIVQNQSITNARTLFLRNMMHELNTPITKGKLIVALSESEHSKLLDSIFITLDQRVKEMVEIEKITSMQYKVNLKQYPIIELLDNASDMLFLDENIEHDIDSQTLLCDFTMMSIVFKNLIDNAQKHGTNLHIFCEGSAVIFENEGLAFKHPLSYYLEAFTQKEQSSNGFGLGLFIVDKTLTQQGFSLQYEFADGKHRFIINK